MKTQNLIKKLHTSHRNSSMALYTMVMAAGWLILLVTGCQEGINRTPEIFKPTDFLNPPAIIDSSLPYGHLGQVHIIVPATADIFLAGAEDGTTLEFQLEGVRDIAPQNKPVKVLDGIIKGGETLDIYAHGTTSHIPLPSIKNPPSGAPDIRIEAGPTEEYRSIEGNMGALVGLFDNSSQPFIIGDRKNIRVPRGASALYLAVLDYPGASANNQRQLQVTIDVIRR